MKLRSAQPKAVERVCGDAGAGTPARHVAIIMDGNGRWAKRRRLPRIAGHKVGVEAVRKVVEAAPGLGISVLTLYAFSSENWKRPEDEVRYLMGLLKQYILSEIAELDRNGIRLSFIGNYRAFPAEVVDLLEKAAARTRDNSKMRLVIALNYGGQDELVRAAQRLAARVGARTLRPEDIDSRALGAELDTADLPPLDLIIRTSGETRLSNFLLWQAAYAELLFTDELWPDFDAQSLARAVQNFTGRDRRYGGL